MARLSESETKSAHSSTQGTNFIGDFKINRLRIFTPQRDRGSFIEFGDGDSLDRERVREIIIESRAIAYA